MKSVFFKNTLKKGLILLILGLIFLFAMGCQEPVPLYGSWADNQGDTISFYDDNTFNGKVKGENIEGNYSILLNALTLSCSDGRRIVTEWDLRGNMLYLHWPKDGETLPLTLYKVSN